MRPAKVAVVGDATSVMAFGSLGFAVFAVEAPAQARGLWPRLGGGEYGVVLLTEEIFEATADLVRAGRDAPLPAVTVIPGAWTEGGAAQARLDAAIERALGTKAYAREQDG
jgi:vacuolar-type H+-ATPase subunit F/Vma7